MPVLIVDTEQAALIKAALQMLQQALTARVERADPEKIISNSLSLQAKKLEMVVVALDAPDPPPFSELDPTLRKKASDLLFALHTKAADEAANQWWQALRAVVNAPGLPRT